MSYENAPATQLVATRCAVCSRALVDAVSVETGIGPECRKKYGFNQEASPEARAEANRLVYRIAARQDGLDVAQACEALCALGFTKLAARIMERLVTVTITEAAYGRLAVSTPYSVEVVDAMRRIPGRRWDGEAKANTFPATERRAIFTALQNCFPGVIATGPRGVFQIPAAPKAVL